MKIKAVHEWQAVNNGDAFRVGRHGAVTPVAFDVISEGVSIFATIGEDAPRLIAYGFGAFRVEFTSEGPCDVSFKGKGATSVRRLDRDMSAGWSDAPSHTDTTPQMGLTVAPEVRMMFETMQRNMLQREAVLRSEFDRRMAAASAAGQ